MNRLLSYLIAVATIPFAAACSDDPPREPDEGGGGSGMVSGSGGSAGSAGSGTTGGTAGTGVTGGTAGSGGMEPTCNELVLDAPAVGFTFTTDPVPTPLGGEIADGTYFLTAYLAHTSVLLPTDPFLRAKFVVTGTTWEHVEGSPDFDATNPPRHFTSTATTNATQISVTRSCPSVGETESAGYTATPEGFTLYIVDAGISVETVFTKQ
jgi:hypothetical protein